MKKMIFKLGLVAILAVTPFVGQQAQAQVPANCGDVMLQAFDYYPEPINIGGTTMTWNDSKWTTLNNQATEIGESFQMIWLPPSARAEGHPTTMGYHPQYYFNQNSTFGTQEELITLISNLKTKNCKAIADIVVNHRSSPTNWCDFAVESYKGVTYTPNSSWICTNDESRSTAPAGCNNPSGANDSGELYPAARDLDHTNSAVRDNIKAYMQFLKNDIGYSGWRYDVAKGFGQTYVAEYNDAAAGTFSVGEVMETSYDYCKTWINNTNKKSTAFDFPCQAGIREALNNSGSPDYTKLVSYGQPRGLIAADMKRYAVTFVENHDTYRYNLGFYGNIEIANAFILSSPGVPCIYLPHWNKYKTNIKKMIAARKKAGLHSESVITNIQSATNIYVAKATGTNGELIVKLGSGSYSVPAGYTLECSGTDWAIWTNVNSKNPTISADKASGLYIGGTNITLSSTGGAAPVKIYYTLNNTAPTTASTLYSTAIPIATNNTILRAIAVDNIAATSSELNNTYLTVQPVGVTVKFLAPAAWTSVACYVWTTATPAVNLAGAWPGTVVTKGTDGYYSYTITNTTSFPVNIIFNNNNNNQQTIDLSASADICWDYSTSSVIGATTKYAVTVNSNCGATTAAVVSATPRGGNYPGGTNVMLSSTGGNAPVSIYYTTNGTTPSISSTLYTSAIPATADGTVIKAIAIDNNNVSSDVITETYTTTVQSNINIYFKVPASWTTVKAWAWKGTTNYTGGVWPGTTLTVIDGFVTFSTPIANSGFSLIFNNGGNNEQTVDITNITTTTCYETTTSTGTNPKKYNVQIISGCSTDINTEKAKPSLSIYPNPAKESLTIESDVNIVEVKIFSINGCLVKSAIINSNRQTIDISGLSSGYYSVLAIAEDSSRTTSKLIKK